MGKKAIIAVALVVLLGAGGWFVLGNKSKSPESSTNTNTNVTSESNVSIKDLLSKGLAQTCTYSTAEGSGKVYVSKGKVRGDFETKVEDRITKGHMILKDNTSYVWTDEQKTGFKMAFDPNSVDTSVSSDTSANSQTANLTADYNYKCSTWIEDSSQFNLPSDVTFTSFEVPAIGPGAPQQGSGTSGSSQACSYCNALTGEDKTQCLTSLNCN